MGAHIATFLLVVGDSCNISCVGVKVDLTEGLFSTVFNHLHSHLRLSGVHDWPHVVCGCGHCQLLREQGNGTPNRGPAAMVSYLSQRIAQAG